MKDNNLAKTFQKFSLLFNLLIVFIYFAIIGYIAFKIYQLWQYQPTIKKAEIQLKQTEEVDKILSTNKFFAPVSITQPTGRSDPMAPF